MPDSIINLEPVDYLVIGHVTQDIVPGGFRLGGTVSYAALTAKALGLRVGIVTAHAEGLLMPELAGITIVALKDGHSTTFENIQTPAGRIQFVHHVAPTLDLNAVPEIWRNTPIVHIGPVCNETDPKLVTGFPNSLIGLTPQGWFRSWDQNGKVFFTEWKDATFALENASAAVLSIEDVKGNEHLIESMVAHSRVLVVTEGAAGERVYWNGDVRRICPPLEQEIDPTGAGDIFATSFFYRLSKTRDPWEAARFATNFAAQSVTRIGLNGVPTPSEVQKYQLEIVTNS
jgi:hypothetical protein